MAEVRMRVAGVVRETADAVSLVLAPEPGTELAYRPGQFLTLRVPGGAARCYSLASSPHTGEPPRITVKKIPGGRGSAWVCERVAVGDEIRALPPAGTFTPDDLDRDLLLVAGGSGITPVLSIAKSALTAGRANVTLLYANRDPDAVIFREELHGLATAHPGRFTVVHWLECLQGLPTTDQLAAVLAPYAGRDVFLCGPVPLMDAAEQAIGRAGGSSIHRERYFSLADDVFGAPVRDPGDGAHTAQVELDGAWHEIPWGAGTPLLDAMLAAGLDAPYSCREGACSACCCRVTDGETALLRNEVLDPEDLADGYILACQAVPLTDRVTVSYE
ncbi:MULTISPECIES: ferredoxin--NADP reductase [unclassified Streptomyces]|uniref:ferredoxin--NADP reductase n=1 Tax=unclassified Streptomyces TaxID=2593676 RepID=UPI00202552EA|nr:ferredoxin--NADP reductase [Streptomyces sp. A 4/2]WSV58140.1 ferredoxin--NADP reductase [Streptomyces sp. NBC_01014]